MTGSRILWGQMLGALFAVLAGLWGATEWTAWRLGFAPALGLPWLQVRGIPIYSPHAFFPWWLRYDRYAPRVFAIGALIATLGASARC
nr:hypothetical protein [Acetobacter persici]